jgi:hypothetical protein
MQSWKIVHARNMGQNSADEDVVVDWDAAERD